MKRCILLLLLMVGLMSKAQERSAFQAAETFVSKHKEFNGHTLTLQQVIESEVRKQPNLFVYDVGGKGFVIVSATQEVLAYSYESVFPSPDDLPGSVAYWLDIYNKITDEQLSKQDPAPLQCHFAANRSVAPLLTSKWSQGCYYNEDCPIDPNGPCSHATAGCVAIAMAQIMYYHRQPLIGEGSRTLYCSNYQQTLTADFGMTCYCWEKMCDSLTEPNPYVAQLVCHCGVGVNMYYSQNNSVATSDNVVSALRDYFGYTHPTLTKREYYSTEAWIELITNDLDRGLPMYYAASNSNGNAHAFVCDGYDEETYFHFNFGWAGNSNGFYSIDDPYGFSDNQKIIYDIIPKSTAQIAGDSHGIIYLDPNGTGDGSSWENASSELQMALNKASLVHHTLWLKEGVYQNPNNGNYAFQFPTPCSVYGSFQGNEPFDYPLDQRDFALHPSILQGNEFQGVMTLSDSFLFEGDLVLDGIIIQNGSANNGGGLLLEKAASVRLENCIIRNNTAKQYGGGVQLNGKAHLSLKNCRICDNISIRYGGGLSAIYNQYSHLSLEDCEVDGNTAMEGGGVLSACEAEFSHCQIHHNTATQMGGGVQTTTSGTVNKTMIFENTDFHHNTALYGGGIQVIGNTRIINCQFHHNTAQELGGGIHTNSPNNCMLINCIVNNNQSHFGGGIYAQKNAQLVNCTVVMNEATEQYGGIYSAPQTIAHNNYTNCIIWGNIANESEDEQVGPGSQYNHCAIQEIDSPTIIPLSWANEGTDHEAYVKFRQVSDQPGISGQGGDWRLEPTSVCIDRGTNPLSMEMPEYDFFGNPRLQHHTYDIGAHETDIAAHLIDARICDGNPYVNDGTIYNEVGFYTQLFQGNDYDSLLVIQLEEGFMPELIITGDTIINKEGVARLSVTGADSYLWSTGDTTATIEVAPLETQTYTVTGISASGCQSEASIRVWVKQIEEILLAPNPADERVLVLGDQIEEIELFTMVGERLCYQKSNNSLVILDVSRYPSGIYILQVKAASSWKCLKLVVAH